MDIELETKLLEQEHRSIRVIQNYLQRKQWTIDDPRRAAVRSALLWWVFSPASAATAGGALAVGTLLMMYAQTALLREQNEAFREQNGKIQSQIEMQRQTELARRRADVIAQIFGGESTERSNWKARTEAVVEYLAIERERKKNKEKEVRRESLAPQTARATFENSGEAKREVPNKLGAGTIVTRVMSEVEHLIMAAGDPFPSRYIDLKRANLKSVDLSGQDLAFVDFSGSDLTGAIFVGANLQNSIVADIKVGGTDFTLADLRNSTIDYEPAPDYIDYEWDVSFRCADLRGAKVTTSGRSQFQWSDLSQAEITYLIPQKSSYRNANVVKSSLVGVNSWDMSPASPPILLSNAVGESSNKWVRPLNKSSCRLLVLQAQIADSLEAVDEFLRPEATETQSEKADSAERERLEETTRQAGVPKKRLDSGKKLNERK
ncbi:pentapeptide repeat-containing protein [Tahibacter soli]|uniref:Pentapeptide repeat-containing protein n=1 Tax=Tahibacter soli TaxID=2983605 RepID=A0A9X4BMD4_9GAMM|nr:pentapeptide repeat-containing protein [Tahibacter soli]MDC8015179.1 pentapeptide repeat-containing protein [Tahibacter soli]